MSDARIGDAARGLLRRAVDERVFPSAVAEVGSRTGRLWGGSVGADPETIFDLASLTKPIATISLVLALIDKRRLALDETVASHFGEWRGDDRAAVTVRQLLEHASGLPARLVEPPPEGRREFEHDICT